MTKIKMTRLFFITGILALVSSCIKAPVEIALNQEIEIDEAKVTKIREEIFTQLELIVDVKPPEETNISNAECNKLFSAWLREQFDRGYLPKDIVLPSEYAQSSNNRYKHECKPVDFDEYYKTALEKRLANVKLKKREGIVFGVSQFRDKLLTNKCTENFLDLKKEKVTIDSITLNVVKNTLSVDAPEYRLYSSYDDDGDINERLNTIENAEEELQQDKSIMFLGKTQAIKVRQVGPVPVEFNPNRKEFFEAEGPVVSLDGLMIAIPQPIAAEPKVVTIGGRQYFVLPKGEFALTLTTQISLTASAADVKCAFDRFKEAIREEEEERSPPRGKKGAKR